MGKKLKLYFDEVGDCRCGEKTSPWFIVAVSAVASELCSPGERDYLESQLSNLGYDGMIHTAQLVRKSGEYANMSLKQRREIFWTLFRYIASGGAKVQTVLADKRALMNEDRLHDYIEQHLKSLVKEMMEASGRANIQINYDGGQRQLQHILESVADGIPGTEYRADFDPRMERAFQASDLATYVQRLIFQLEQDLPLNKSDKIFFTSDDLELFKKYLENWRH